MKKSTHVLLTLSTAGFLLSGCFTAEPERIAECGSSTDASHLARNSGGEEEAISAPLDSRRSELPNLVLIMADDLGYGDIGAYDGWVQTPHIDRLAAEGIRFTDFHASGPTCVPTRAGLMTGRYQQRSGITSIVDINDHRTGLQPEKEITFSRLLDESGYSTALFGKWHLGNDERFNPIHHGFDRFRGFVSGNVDYISHISGSGSHDWWDGVRPVRQDGYTTHLITDCAVAFIEENRNRPFLLYVAHAAPHFPYQGSGDKPVRIAGRQGKIDMDPARVKGAYRSMVEELDKSVGAITATLKRLGLADNSFVFFLSDNGAMETGSNGPLRGFKGSLLEGGHRVPAIAWWPGHIKAGAVTDELAISIDLMPTLLEFAGADLPESHRLDGQSLVPLLVNNMPLGHRTLFWGSGRGAAGAVRQGSWKLISDREGVKLYNLSNDVHESEDLAERFPDRVNEMLEMLESWGEDVGAGANRQSDGGNLWARIKKRSLTLLSP